MGCRLPQHISPPVPETDWHAPTGVFGVHRHVSLKITPQPRFQLCSRIYQVLWASHSVIYPPWSPASSGPQTASPSKRMAVAGTIGLAGRGQGNDQHLESTPQPPTVTAAGGRNPQHPGPRAYSKVKGFRFSFPGWG